MHFRSNHLISGLFYLLVLTSQTFSQIESVRPKIAPTTWKHDASIIEKRFTQLDGLPVNGLVDLEIGLDGNLYIASYGGLVRFNGFEFHPIEFPDRPELNTARLVRVTQLPDSTFLIGTESHRYYLRKNGRTKELRFRPSQVSAPSPPVPMHQFRTPDPSLFVYTTNRLAKLTFETADNLQSVYETSSDSIIVIAPVSNSSWWISSRDEIALHSEGHINRRIPKKNLPFHIPYPAIIKPVQNGGLLYFGPVGALLFDASDALIGQLKLSGNLKGDHLRTVRQRSDEVFEFLSSKGIRFLWSASRGILHTSPKLPNLGALEIDTLPEYWLGKRLDIGQNGVLLDGKPLYFPERENMMSSVRIDAYNQLWIASAGDGLIRFQENPFHSINKNNGLPGENVYSVVRWNDSTLAVASFDAGTLLVEPGKTIFWNLPFQLQATRAVFKAQSGTLFTGYNVNGFQSLQPDFSWRSLNKPSLQFNPLGLYAEAFFEDMLGNFWIGTRDALLRQKDKSEEFISISKPDGSPIPRTHGFASAPDSSVIVLTGGHGVWRFSEKTGALPLLESESSLQATRDVHFQSASTWWFASETRGLVRVSWINADSTQISIIDRSAGLPDNAIHRIIPDNFGFWWLNSNQGIIRVSENELNAYLDEKGPFPYFELFQESQGLASREGNGGANSAGFKDADGTIWFPTQKGLVHFDPKFFLTRNSAGPAQLRLLSIETANRKLLPEGNAMPELNADERDLVIRFDALFLASTKEATFEYRLDEATWLPLGKQRFVTLSNLENGENRLEVRQHNAGNAVRPLLVAFTIAPFFHETKVFYWLLGFFGVLTIGFTFLITRNVAQRRQKFLENLADKRTEEVRAQAEQLRDLNQHKSDMVLGLTHELRTPLALIQGPLELLQQPSIRLDNETAALQIALAKRNTSQLQKLVDQLLQLARLDDQAHPLKQIPVNVDERLKAFVAQLKKQLVHSSKTVEIEIRNSVGTVLTDPDLLELSVSNLVSNALKYAGDALVVNVQVDCDTEFFRVSVQNGGNPIPEADQKRLFDLFFRGNNVGRKAGSGVGLTIVKRLVEKLDGTVSLVSNKDVGTIFTLQLPRIKTDLEDVFEVDVYSEKSFLFEDLREPETAEISGKKPVLLIVEDNADLRTLLETALKNDYEIQFAENGEIGVSRFTELPIELIISDVMMPVMDGFAFAERIRATEKGAHIPFVFLSANDRPDAFAKGLSLGADAYLTKPVSLELLKAHIWALIRRKKTFASNAHVAKMETENELVSNVDRLILLHLSNPELSVESIANALNMSRASFYRAWEKTGEESVNERIVKTRLNLVLEMVKDKKFNFTQAALACGFSDSANFSRSFKRVFGKSPREFIAE